ncbi:Mo-dependent nitrogenase [Cyanobium sp. FGCU-6]|nr:Mo-dependent nitrogenase [Cyanobium sp. FGCU6]
MPSNDLRRRRLWLAALHHLAIADGDFSTPEVALLEEELRRELPGIDWDDLHLPGAEALAHRFVPGSPLAEEFLRTAVVVALADGCISPIERELLQHWSAVLQVGQEALADLHPQRLGCDTESEPGLLNGLRRWLDEIDPTDPAVARFLVRLIPAQCPFERDVTLFGRKVVHIPPMCKINPLYEQLVALRFRCLCRLAEMEESPGS